MRAPPGEPAIIVRPDVGGAAGAVAAILAQRLAEGAATRGRADLASTGGSTPAFVYRALLAEPLRALVPWDVLHVWLGDDRFVPRGDPDSNMVPIDRVLLHGDAQRGLAPPPLDPARVHPWPTDAALAAAETPAACAARFEALLRLELTVDGAERPLFDALLAGVGPDGHLLSIFPGSAAWDAPGWTTWAPAPAHVSPHLERVTLTPSALDASPGLVVAAFGASKAAIVGELLGPAHADPGGSCARRAEAPGPPRPPRGGQLGPRRRGGRRPRSGRSADGRPGLTQLPAGSRGRDQRDRRPPSGDVAAPPGCWQHLRAHAAACGARCSRHQATVSTMASSRGVGRRPKALSIFEESRMNGSSNS